MSSSSSSSSADAPVTLPPGWTKEFSKSQKKVYYYHHKTNARQWHVPTVTEAQNPQLAAERARRKTLEESTGPSTGPSNGGSSGVKRKRDDSAKPSSSSSSSSSSAKPSSSSASATPPINVAIIVPFRDLHPSQNRSHHLSLFCPHIHTFLSSSSSLTSHHIFIIEQSSDSLKFNRGKLLNIGYDLAKSYPINFTTYIFHDVDLLPSLNLLPSYVQIPSKPLHIARCWDRYSNNPRYFGGIVSFTSSQMEAINGYPNNFWGWGGEDDEMNKRCETVSMKWVGVKEGGITDLEDMDITEKINFLRGNKEWKCHMKNEVLAEHSSTWRTNGLSDLSYDVLGRKLIDEEKCGEKAEIITVRVGLNGDHWTNEKSGVENLDYTDPEEVKRKLQLKRK